MKTEILQTTIKGSKKIINLYFYDDNSFLVKRQGINSPNFNSDSYTTFSYDKNGNIIQKYEKLTPIRTFYSYDSKNRLISEKAELESPGFIREDSISYNNYNMVYKSSTGEDLPNSIEKYEYKYDKNNNWIYKNTIKYKEANGRVYNKANIKIKRTITYHK